MKDELLITPGAAEVRNTFSRTKKAHHPVVRVRSKGSSGETISTEVARFQTRYEPTAEDQSHATLYAEAHNAYNETKLSPRQMVERIKALELDLGLMTIDRDHWKEQEAFCNAALAERDYPSK